MLLETTEKIIRENGKKKKKEKESRVKFNPS